MKNKTLQGVLAIIVLALVAIGFSKYQSSSTKSEKVIDSKSADSVKVEPTVVLDKYKDWDLFRNGYALPIPADWKNTSDIGGKAILAPGSKLGTIQEVSVQVLSDTRANGKRFTEQKEFDQWYAVNSKVQGLIQKPKNTTVDGEKAVVLIDTSNGEDNWVAITWIRKDNRNIYITAKGNQPITKEDSEAFDYISSHFTFTAPPSTEKKDK